MAEAGKFTILVVDDDPALRKIAASALERLGYTVITAGCGDEAAECLKNGSHVDLVLMDLTLEGESGNDVLQRLRQVRPELKAVLMSGYHAETGVDGYLQKPFSIANLQAAVEKALL